VKVAVTGATGFIGRHVVAEVVRHDLAPTLLVRDPARLPGQLAKLASVTFDLRNPPVDAFEKLGRPDALIHLAWGGLPNYRSLHHYEEEAPAHYRFLKGLIQSGLGNLVVTGTCAEYGMQPGPLDEEIQPVSENPYGFAKNMLRRQLAYLQNEIPFNLTWCRMFYLYGDGQPAGSLLPQLKRAVEQGLEAFDMSGGEQLRDYMRVNDAASALVDLALAGRNNGIVNVCSGRPISIHNLVEGWIRQNGWKIRLNLGYYPYPDYEPMAFWGDRTKLDRILSSP
jgi:nucleoside-diphosphate-sugar epimerase